MFKNKNEVLMKEQKIRIDNLQVRKIYKFKLLLNLHFQPYI